MTTKKVVRITGNNRNGAVGGEVTKVLTSGGATPGGARSNDLAKRSTTLAPAPPIALLCFGNSVNRK